MALGLVQTRTDLITATPKQLESSSPRHHRLQRLSSISNQKHPINVDIRYLQFYFLFSSNMLSNFPLHFQIGYCSRHSSVGVTAIQL